MLFDRASTPQFLTPLDVRTVSQKKWILLHPLLYRSRIAGVIHVPRGFVSDFASVPYGLRGFLPRDEKTALAAVVHDWLYRVGHLSKEVADAVFYEALVASSVSTVFSFTMWIGVAYGGFIGWNKRRAVFPATSKDDPYENISQFLATDFLSKMDRKFVSAYVTYVNEISAQYGNPSNIALLSTDALLNCYQPLLARLSVESERVRLTSV